MHRTEWSRTCALPSVMPESAPHTRPTVGSSVALRARMVPVEGNTQRLDGGAMFGNAPKAMWSRWMTPDADNRILLTTRALLIQEESGRNVLLEAGIGAFFEPQMRNRYGVLEDHHVLLENLADMGVSPSDIDVVVLSHLHFDHAGGLLDAYQPDTARSLVFDRAVHLVSEAAWVRGRDPHPRDKASFIAELPGLLEESGRLEVVDGEVCETLGAGYRFHFSQGHTPGLMLTEVGTADGPVLFAGDLIPARPWVHVPITMGYDRFPELLIDEKAALLEDLHSRGGRLVLTHDPDVAVVWIERDEHGRYSSRPGTIQ